MKKYTVFLILMSLLIGRSVYAQDSCITALPFCSGQLYEYNLATGVAAPTGPNYGCLGSQASPFWISVYVTAPGDIDITGAGVDLADNPLDIDFIYWGPFPSLSGVCYGQLDAAHIVGCDYSTNNLIDFNIVGATAGSYYIAMISNYSGQPAVITYTQTAGSGLASCILPCVFNGLTASPSACDSADNTYNVSGFMQFSNPPATGTLTVFGSCGGSQTFTAPFVSPINYTLSGLASDGSNCFVSAIFSDGNPCSLNQAYTAPAVCNPNVGVGELSNLLEFTMMPNPSDGIVSLHINGKSDHTTLTITDISGRTVAREELGEINGKFEKQMNLSAFSKGIYFVRVSSPEQSSIQKLIYR